MKIWFKYPVDVLDLSFDFETGAIAVLRMKFRGRKAVLS